MQVKKPEPILKEKYGQPKSLPSRPDQIKKPVTKSPWIHMGKNKESK